VNILGDVLDYNLNRILLVDVGTFLMHIRNTQVLIFLDIDNILTSYCELDSVLLAHV
jgi:hypothetical protein